MAITTSDILIKLSTTAGSAGNSQAQATPDNSLGKYISTTQMTDNTLGNLFSVITGDQNAASEVTYRCLFIHNAHATLTLIAPKLWVVGQVSGGADAAIGVDTTAASALANASAQALTIANGTTAPAGVSFSAPSSKATGLSLSDIGPGQVKAFWVRRSATNSSPLNTDNIEFAVEGDTEA